MIVKHRHFKGGTQTVDGTVYQINPQGYADMSPEHAAAMVSNPVFGWELWQPPAQPEPAQPEPVAKTEPPPPPPPPAPPPPAPVPAPEPVAEAPQAMPEEKAEEKPQPKQEPAGKRKPAWREKE